MSSKAFVYYLYLHERCCFLHNLNNYSLLLIQYFIFILYFSFTHASTVAIFYILVAMVCHYLFEEVDPDEVDPHS